MRETDREALDASKAHRVRGIFSLIADKYDLFNALASLGIDRGWRRATVDAAYASPTATHTILDLCAGTGDLTLALARRGGATRVVGSDFTPEMLDVARRKLAEKPVPDVAVSFDLADAQDLPYEDAGFDAATVAFGVRNLPDRAANFSEVLRVLHPGGRYVILEFSRPLFAPWRWVYHVYLGVVIPLIGGILTGDMKSFVYLNDSIRAFPDQAELAEELRRAGFADVTWRNLTGGIVAVHVATKSAS